MGDMNMWPLDDPSMMIRSFQMNAVLDFFLKKFPAASSLVGGFRAARLRPGRRSKGKMMNLNENFTVRFLLWRVILFLVCQWRRNASFSASETAVSVELDAENEWKLFLGKENSKYHAPGSKNELLVSQVHTTILILIFFLLIVKEFHWAVHLKKS